MPSKKKTARKKKKESEIKITPAKVVALLAVIAVALLVVNYAKQPKIQPPATTPQDILQGDTLAGREYVEPGDVVSVDYTGRYAKNKSVFDTSIMDAAEKEGVYNELRAYQPVKVIMGRGEFILGFETALLGMKVGEEKTVTIPPEEAYGEYDPTKIAFVNRTQQIPKIMPVEYSYFVSAFETEPVEGESYTALGSSWPLKVVNITDDMVYVEQEAEVGSKIDGMFGEADVVKVTDDTIFVRENPTEGQTVYSAYGSAKVLDYNETEITVDLNHPLAGETLEFTIIVRDLMKA